MMLITALVGSLLASKTLAPLSLIAFAMLGIALCASSAAAINQIIDRKTDANMNRTENRPCLLYTSPSPRDVEEAGYAG